MTSHAAYSWIRCMVTATDARRIENTLWRDQIDQGEFLHAAINAALDASERGQPIIRKEGTTHA